MILYVDTETTGMPLNSVPLDDQAQPHLVQLGVIVVDQEQQVTASFCLMVKPAGWRIDPRAQATHGISAEYANAHGIREADAVQLLCDAARNVGTVVAHRVQFDHKILAIALQRHAPNLAGWWEGLTTVCTMELARPLCALPMKGLSPRTPRGFKAPTLGEAFFHFFKREMPGATAHDAGADVRCCRAIHRAILRDQPGLL